MKMRSPVCAVVAGGLSAVCRAQVLHPGLNASADWSQVSSWLFSQALPGWLDLRRPVLLMAVLLLLTFAAGMRAWMVERKVRREITAQAYIERRRARILEDINTSRPLAEILESITELVSARLNGAPCWCQVAGGGRIGARPAELQEMRVVDRPIRARSGPSLGVILAAFPPSAPPHLNEEEVLVKAAGLATLAIETSRFYSDLVHRSEFDTLTEIRNRFSFERELDAMIESARRSASNFGLIYLDLNGFKVVNDVYGHRAGDDYLRVIAKRFKRQLRPSDTLARMGGDEFAVLLPDARSRESVVEVAVRLQHVFDEPIHVAGKEILGSASVGMALYPNDASSKDGLINSADSAMYAAKNLRRA